MEQLVHVVGHHPETIQLNKSIKLLRKNNKILNKSNKA